MLARTEGSPRRSSRSCSGGRRCWPRTGTATPARWRVGADDLDAALDELLDTRNAMTRVLLGSGGPDQPAPAPTAFPQPGLAPDYGVGG